ncbi:MAG: TolC family protein [Sphingobacteriales bacterium]|nr:MAG: TolC family protein [Sphingobacteriales bacterium]
MSGQDDGYSLQLQQVQELARANYPLIKQKDLVNKTAALNIANISKGYLPQLLVNGQATYQSDVTSVNIPIPNIKIDAPEKDQYKIFAEASQLLYDGGQIKAQKLIQDHTRRADEQQIEVELYKIRQRVNTMYLGVLYLDEQLKQLNLLKDDIRNGLKSMEAKVANGIAFRSNLNVLKAELLKQEQREQDIAGSREGLIDMLGVFINHSLDSTTRLMQPLQPLPGNQSAAMPPVFNRPELKQFAERAALLGLQEKLVSARNRPRASLFFQTGYGRPALNLLKNEFEFYYIGGIRLNWNLGGLYTAKKERALIAISQDNVSAQLETFLINTRAELAGQQAEINKLSRMIATDNEIIRLRNEVRNASMAQLENGVITASDYLREINAADQAVQSKISHEIQLLQAKINYRNTVGE